MILWSNPVPYKRPLKDLEHATMDDLQTECKYVCKRLKECFESVDCNDLQGELEWYQRMNEYFQRLRRVHHEFDTRRHIAAEMRRKYDGQKEV